MVVGGMVVQVIVLGHSFHLTVLKVAPSVCRIGAKTYLYGRAYVTTQRPVWEYGMVWFRCGSWHRFRVCITCNDATRRLATVGQATFVPILELLPKLTSSHPPCLSESSTKALQRVWIRYLMAGP
jgi:hypothetical protein